MDAPFTSEWDTQFKGIYTPIPLRCFSSDGRYLLVRSKSGSRSVVYIYDFIKHNLISLDSPLGMDTSVCGLAVFGHYVAVNINDFRTPYRLYVFDLKALTKTDNNGWHLIAEHQFKQEGEEEIHPIQWNLDRFFPDNDLIPVESIYVHEVNTQSKRPLMVMIHGGPNVNISCRFFNNFFILKILLKNILLVGYDTDVLTYISAGFDILLVNYRGSIGFGQGKWMKF
jgi:dipeptidyl aminopeptidase/acylaminoacyl peptidase